MAEIQVLRPADLLIDEENPRILDPNQGQPQALHALADELGDKLYVHAADIVEHGLDPSTLPIVEALQGTPQRYRVLEGNRRLAAIRCLENPELVAGHLPAESLKKLRRLNKDYLAAPIDSITCVVMDREESRHWIQLRHTGENKGAGTVPWGSDESARFQARSGGKQTPAHLQALEFLTKRGDLSLATRKKVAATTFRRLIDTPAVRTKLGLAVEDGVLKAVGAYDKVAKALMHVVDDLVSGRINVSDVYHLPQRIDYANKLPATIVVKPTSKASPQPLVAGTAAARARRSGGRKRLRDRLVPPDCVLNVPDGRCSQIEQELRRTLSLEKHTNAISVLFRVFVELSLDDYLERHPISGVTADTRLRVKIDQVSIALEASGRLNKQQGKAIRSANNPTSSLLVPTVQTMHEYVHNQHAFPGPADLRQHWNGMQPLMAAIWT